MIRMTSFEKALAKTLQIEGGYVNHWADRGGKTRYGITEETARRNGYEGEMSELPHDQALDILKREYWNDNNLPCEAVSEWDEPIALELFDSSVLHGPVQAAKFLQEALNLMNRDQSDRYSKDLKVDGWAGGKTLEAMKLLYRDKDVILKMLNGLQAEFMFNIARRDSTQEWNLVGWMRHRVGFNS